MKLPLSTLVLAGLSAGVAAQSGLYSFDATSAFCLPAKDTRSLVVEDLDGDGDLDVLAINFSQPPDLYDNRGDGLLTAVAGGPLTASTDDSYDAAAGDIDGDGDLDLVVANGSTAPNMIYRNVGNPATAWADRFVIVASDPVSQTNPNTFAVAFSDFDRDGDQDLAFANRDAPNTLYLNDGTGAFAADTTTPVDDEQGATRDVAIGDLDGDGDDDLVFVNSDDQPRFIFINQGADQGGTPGDFARLTGDPAADDLSEAYGATLGDWNGDGDLDLFVANRHDNLNQLYGNDGGAGFTLEAGQHPSQDAGDSFAGSFGDADNDGDMDLFVANRLQVNFLYLNDGTDLVRQTSGPVVSGTQDSRKGAFADLDADGWNELLVANTNSQTNELYDNLLSHWVDLGSAFQPVAGEDTPRLSAGGALAGHTWVHYFVDDGPDSAATTMVAGASQINAPFRGGVLVPSPDLLIPGFTTAVDGSLKLSFVVPGGLPAGFAIHHQVWMVEPASPAGLVATNGLRGTTP